MLKRERQEYILREVNLHNRVLTSDLSEAINVSEDTIRRDLSELSETGKIIKAHGGALSKSFHTSFQINGVYSHDKKKCIAQKAVTLIQDGMFILSGGGTTITELAKALPEQLQATFFTGSLPAAIEYIQHPTAEVIFIGDRVSKNSRITVGGDAIQKIGQINADLCFLGINALDPEKGLTDNDWDVVQIKKAMIRASRKVVALTISEKLFTQQKIRVAELAELDIIITELSPDDPKLDPFRKAGIQIL
jgi:DeoR/GlpR family transcriptional regulator of sugar metabolism